MKPVAIWIPMTLLLFLSACSSPQERFVDAAAKSGTLTSDRKVLECAAEKLQKKLSAEEFGELIDDLEEIAAGDKETSDASVKGMSAMTVAVGACTAGNLIDGLMGGGKSE